VLYQLKYMKYNPILRSKRLNAAGFTLIEISLVIALLLGLIAVVFLGLGSYREGANQATCKMQLASVQKAIRSFANMQGKQIGDTLDSAADVFVAGGAMATAPTCPAGGTYTWRGDVPPIGTPYGDCDEAGPPSHVLGTSASNPALADW
jgi:type II secretory pathway pseudopilin PulG